MQICTSSPASRFSQSMSCAIGVVAIALVSSGPAKAQLAPQGPALIEFDGINQLAAEATRVGMLTQVLKYTLTVGPDGKPTECEIDREFRRKYIKIALCRPLLKHHSFQPARDRKGNAIEGTYRAEIDFRMFFNQDGGSNARNW